MAGEVVDANGSPRFKVEDQVFGAIPVPESFKSGQGALAQYAYVPASAITHRPENISPNEASGIAIVAITAYAAVYQIGKLEAGQRIFINGGSTSVGMYVIQFAKALGCKVYASASGKNEDFLKSLGVDVVRIYPPRRFRPLTGGQFYDYTKQPIHEALVQNPPSSKFDVILEAVGRACVPLFTHSEAYLAPNGTYISVGPTPDGVGETLSLIWNVFMRPKWAGGTKRQFQYVPNPPLSSLTTLSVNFLSNRLLRAQKGAEVLAEITKMIADGEPHHAYTRAFL